MHYPQHIIDATNQQNLSVLATLEPDTRRKAYNTLLAAARAGILLRMNNGYRTLQEQQSLYDQGKTNTPPGYSWHNHRMAFDASPIDPQGNSLTQHISRDQWKAIGKFGKDQLLRWGGDFSDYDPVHWDNAIGKNIRDYAPQESQPPAGTVEAMEIPTHKKGKWLWVLPVSVLFITFLSIIKKPKK